MVYVFLAEGFEEIEALAVIDILRRAEIPVKIVGVGGKNIRGAHQITVSADMEINDISEDADFYVLPGGMPGTENLYADDRLKTLIKKAYDGGKYLCAICAAPLILGRLGILNGKNACCYPGFEKELAGANVLYEPVAADGNIITARAAGAAHLFAFKIVETIKGEDAANSIKKAMLYE